MKYSNIDKYDWIKITTRDKREFGVCRPCYNTEDDTISGSSVYEVTKNKSNDPYSYKFLINEIDNIEYGSTIGEVHKSNRWFNVFFVIIFIIVGLVAYVRQCT